MPDEKQNQPDLAQTPAQQPADRVGLRVSLIPAEETARQDPARGFRRFLIAVIVFTVAIGSLAGYLYLTVNVNAQAIAKLDASTLDLAKQSKDIAPLVKDAKNDQAQLKALSALLSTHKTGLRVFGFLEAHTLPDVSYSSVSMSDNGTVNLTVSAASFESYAAQYGEFLAQPEVKSLTVSSLSPNYDQNNVLTNVDFSLTLIFNPAIFLSQSPSS